jgi:hypothetical protein
MAQHTMGFDGVDFKDFRDSPDGDEALEDIHNIIRGILKEVTIVEQSYDNAEIERLLVMLRLCRPFDCGNLSGEIPRSIHQRR